MVAVLGSWLTAWWIEASVGLRADVIILGTVLANSLSRSVSREHQRTWWRRAIRLVTVPVVAMLAATTGRLIVDHRWWGGAAFVLAMSVSIFVRRFGATWTFVGTLVAMPFVVLLIAPVGVARGGEGVDSWPALIAVVSLLWVVGVQQVAWWTGFVPVPPYAPGGAIGRQGGWLPATTRLAIQMGLSLAVAYVLARWWFPEHWAWMLLSCYVVGAGNRGRGDVVEKGLMRLVGALIGTAVATLLAAAFPPGDDWAVAILFTIMFFSLWLQRLSYAFWAGGVTAMVALLHGYYGEGGADLLVERLVGVVLGAGVAVAVAWFVLPVHSRDAFRRRWADALAATSELLTALRTGPDQVPAAQQDLDYAVAQLGLVEPAWRLHERVFRGGDGHPAELVLRLREVTDALDKVAALPPELLVAHRDRLVDWARQLGAVRRRMRGEPGERVRLDPVGIEEIDHVSWAIGRLDTSFTTTAWEALKR